MKENNQMDERQVQINLKAMCFGGGFMTLCAIISMICKLVATQSLGWEFFALIGACAVIGIASHMMGDIEQPKDLFKRPLPTGSTKEERNLRKKNYALESLIFATACTVMDVLLFTFGQTETADLSLTQYLFPGLHTITAVALSAVFSFAVTFGLSYLFDYLYGEKFKVARYNKMIRELDSDDE